MNIIQAMDGHRSKLGWTKNELAKRAGIQPAAIRRLFSGNANPTLETLSALADALGCSVELASVDGTVTRRHRSEELQVLCDAFCSEVPDNICTVLADPPWRFQNRTGKVAPEHHRLSRYDTLTTEDICDLPVESRLCDEAHLYLWVPNALVGDGLRVMQAWGFTYKSNIVWAKRRKDGGPDGRGVGFYFRNVTELVLFGVKGKMRTLAPGRRQVNMIETRKREHSRKPDELYDVIESCSPGPYLEMFARYPRRGWHIWGNEADESIVPRGQKHSMYKGGSLQLPYASASTSPA